VESDKSAARFFYCAKASRADRDEGLEALRKAKPEELTGRKGGSAGLVMEDGKANPFAGTTGQVPRANIHPTVKPTELMRWLARLVTPPGGTILDPFMGSGSTGKAAVWEGFRFIGCEREDEYIPIAEARIRYAIENPPGAAKKKKPANDNTPPAQAGGATTDLFGGAV
jgi:site-specific DNA-methyltransferase (adenine-specific)